MCEQTMFSLSLNRCDYQLGFWLAMLNLVGLEQMKFSHYFPSLQRWCDVVARPFSSVLEPLLMKGKKC